MTFKFHEDPGHGWLEVPKSESYAIGIAAAQYSRFSYREGDTFYLEEDCDAPRFIRAWQAKHGKRMETGETIYWKGNCPIRTMARIDQF